MQKTKLSSPISLVTVEIKEIKGRQENAIILRFYLHASESLERMETYVWPLDIFLVLQKELWIVNWSFYIFTSLFGNASNKCDDVHF